MVVRLEVAILCWETSIAGKEVKKIFVLGQRCHDGRIQFSDKWLYKVKISTGQDKYKVGKMEQTAVCKDSMRKVVQISYKWMEG